MIQEFDINRDQKINFEEFREMLLGVSSSSSALFSPIHLLSQRQLTDPNERRSSLDVPNTRRGSDSIWIRAFNTTAEN